MSPVCIGFDTSCYATSVACVNTEGIFFQKKTMLPVASGERGLRQSDGVFLHVRALESLTHELFQAVSTQPVFAVAVSSKPTDAPDSYMPVFLAGVATATATAEALHVPLVKSTHQRGHIRAALFGNEELRWKNRFLALHLSGGTTDLLDVHLYGGCIDSVQCIGGSTDLHIGQFVDRIGVRLGLQFPAGAYLEEMARQAIKRDVKIPASVRGLQCSFSGPESHAHRLLDGGLDNAELAYGIYDCMARTVGRLVDNTGEDTVLLCGGVSDSQLFQTLLKCRTKAKLYAAGQGLSGDNAVGTALLGMDTWKAEQ